MCEFAVAVVSVGVVSGGYHAGEGKGHYQSITKVICTYICLYELMYSTYIVHTYVHMLEYIVIELVNFNVNYTQWRRMMKESLR